MQGDDNTANTLLTPIRQDTVLLFGTDVLAVQLADGRIGATLASLCDALDLVTRSQARRIGNDEILSRELLSVAITTAGGVQTMGVLTAWAIPLWLTGVHTTRLAETKRAAILSFKREAANVLYAHFASRQSLLKPITPVEQPVAPADDAPRNAWASFYRAMAA